MGEQRNNCKTEIISKVCKNVCNGSQRWTSWQWHVKKKWGRGWTECDDSPSSSTLACRDCQTWGSRLEQHVCHQPAKLQDCFQDFVTLLFVQEWLPCHFPEHSLLLSEDRKEKSLLTPCAHIQFYQSLSFCLDSLFMAVITYSLFSGALPDYPQSEMSPLRGLPVSTPEYCLSRRGSTAPPHPFPSVSHEDVSS